MSTDDATTGETGAESFWAGRSVLVTGGCGFIGSHLVDALLGLGADVVVLDAYNASGSSSQLEGRDDPNLAVHLGDVADPFFVRRLIEGVDTVFHLASLIGIPYSYVAPAHYVRTNVEGTLAVLEAARGEDVRRVVHTSTSEVYGSAQYRPIDESHPLVGQSPSAATKIAADQLAGSYFRSFDTPVTTLRPFNTFGPRQSLRAVLPTLMAQALHSDRIRVGALDPVRDMNVVDDTVSGFLGVGVSDGVEGEVYNVGSGVGRTNAEMLADVQDVAGVDKPVEQEGTRIRPAKSEVEALVCDYGKAGAAFGYAPSVGFREGLSRLRDELDGARAPADPSEYHV
jgi:nucleoside-diphosphate-sugar epimerase